MDLLGTIFGQGNAAKTYTTNTTTTHAPSPRDDLENVAGITVDEENAEINLNEDPFVTLKQRFPRLDCKLRDALETIGQAMQECTVEVKIWKKSYANFVVAFGADPYILKAMMVKMI
jgi:hypothetical protein